LLNFFGATKTFRFLNLWQHVLDPKARSVLYLNVWFGDGETNEDDNPRIWHLFPSRLTRQKASSSKKVCCPKKALNARTGTRVSIMQTRTDIWFGKISVDLGRPGEGKEMTQCISLSRKAVKENSINFYT
jgi:hypothetical protein